METASLKEPVWSSIGGRKKEMAEPPTVAVVARTVCELGSLCGGSALVFLNTIEIFHASSGHPCLEIYRGLEGLGAINICEKSIGFQCPGVTDFQVT